jgi:hypothetical protein
MALLVCLFFGLRADVPVFAAFVYWLDRYEKEPVALLGAAFMWGVVIAAGGAYIHEHGRRHRRVFADRLGQRGGFQHHPSSRRSSRRRSKGLAVPSCSSCSARNSIPSWTASSTAPSLPWALPPSRTCCTSTATASRKAAGKASVRAGFHPRGPRGLDASVLHGVHGDRLAVARMSKNALVKIIAVPAGLAWRSLDTFLPQHVQQFLRIGGGLRLHPLLADLIGYASCSASSSG